MKLVYNLSLETTRTERTYSDPNDLNIYTDNVISCINVTNIRADIRIESDSYSILETEKLLVDISIIVECKMVGLIDYNDLRKYLIINVLPNWETLSEVERLQLKSYYIIPNDFTFNSEEEEQAIYKLLVDNATLCRKSRVDAGRSYVSLLYKTQTQKSQDFFIDTEAMMNRFIEGKIPELQAFINNSIIGGFNYEPNGFSTKSYYTEALKDKLNYILFR